MSLQTQVQRRDFSDDQLICGFLEDYRLRNLTPESDSRINETL